MNNKMMGFARGGYVSSDFNAPAIGERGPEDSFRLSLPDSMLQSISNQLQSGKIPNQEMREMNHLSGLRTFPTCKGKG